MNSARKNEGFMSTNDAILRFIGLAMRAGKVVSGFDMVSSSLRRGEVKLLIIAEDISRNTLDKLLDAVAASKGESPDAFRFANSFDLGNAIGKPSRAILAIIDDGFAGKLSTMLSELDVMEDK